MDHNWVPDIPPRPHSSRVLKHGPASTFFLVVSNGMVGLVGLKSEIVWSNFEACFEGSFEANGVWSKF